MLVAAGALFSSPGVGMGGEIRGKRHDTLDTQGSEAGRKSEIPKVDQGGAVCA